MRIFIQKNRKQLTMKLNREGSTEEQKIQKLRRISYKEKDRNNIKVYTPVDLEKESNDAVLTGFRSSQPVSFNITGYYPARQSVKDRDHASLSLPGDGMIGYFIGQKPGDELLVDTDSGLSGNLKSKPVELIEYLERLFNCTGELSGKNFIAGFREKDRNVFFYFNDGIFHPCESET